jgi:hypothetical protein
MVYNNHDLEEGKREQTKEKSQAKIIISVIDDSLESHDDSLGSHKMLSNKTDGDCKKLPCFKCRKTRNSVKACSKLLPGC